MQLITEAYDLFKTVYGLDASAIAKIFEEWKTGRPRFLPDRDHGGGAEQARRDDRRSRWSMPSSTRPSRRAPAAGRPAIRARSRSAADRDHRSRLRPRPVGTVVRSAPRPRSCFPTRRRPARKPRSGGHRRDPRRALRLEDRRLCARLRADDGRLEGVRLGSAASARSRRSGAAAASSAPASSTGSPRPMRRRRRNVPTSCCRTISVTPC